MLIVIEIIIKKNIQVHFKPSHFKTQTHPLYMAPFFKTNSEVNKYCDVQAHTHYCHVKQR